jgi:hypothetical protein
MLLSENFIFTSELLQNSDQYRIKATQTFDRTGTKQENTGENHSIIG